MLSRTWKRLYSGLFLEWNIGVVREPISIFLESGAKPKIEWLTPLHGKSLADPFAIVQNHRTHILCEEFDSRTLKGRIVTFELRGNLASETRIVLEEPFHVSYPYLIDHDDEIFLVPETYQAQEIRLYKAAHFPHDWTMVDVLISDFAGIDPTIFQHEDRWWLMCTYARSSADTLFAWYADDLFGPWQAHATNPIKIDAGSSRPAGTPFLHNGLLYRPAQDCSKEYGRRIVINRVKVLTPDQFEEHPAAVIEPNENTPYIQGIHTVSSAGNMTLIDGKHVRSATEAFKSAIINREKSQKVQ